MSTYTVVDVEVVRFLGACEAARATLPNLDPSSLFLAWDRSKQAIESFGHGRMGENRALK